MAAPTPQPIAVPSPSITGGRSRRRRLLAIPALLALFLTACSSGPGTQEEFVDILTRNGNLTEGEATCIADAVFEEYGADEDALGRISSAPDIEFLDGENGVPGFTEFYRDTVAGCAQTGPVQS